MKKLNKIILLLMFMGWFIGLLVILSYGSDVSVLNPEGIIAEKERNLIIFASALSLLVVVPVVVLTFGIAWRYREGNKKATYKPNWDHSNILESIWWGVPLGLIIVLSVVTYRSSHELDPFKPLQADNNTSSLTIQVVALQGKWLFIYPEQGLASINYVQFPKNTPINFEITADAPMNSFWIPSLGGQIYAMNGMATELHLQAKDVGIFRGSSANISGRGFANMTFMAESVDQTIFKDWAKTLKEQNHILDTIEYIRISSSSDFSPKILYSSVEPDLFDKIIAKFSSHEHSMTGRNK